MTNDFITTLDHNIFLIDTGYKRPSFDGSYLVVGNKKAAFIDCGTNYSVPRLISALDVAGIGIKDVSWVIATHVHLDHAGGAGLLLQSLPEARLLVHPRGARHMIDPSNLIKGSIDVYGSEVVARDYGEVQPIPEELVINSYDGMEIDLSGRRMQLIDTPGHALHHHCIWDETSRGWFTGDAFGLSYQEFDTQAGRFVMPATTPSQFDPDAMRQSIERMLATRPEIIYPTHFGHFTQPEKMAKALLDQVDGMVSHAISLKHDPDRNQKLIVAFRNIYCSALEATGWNGDKKLRDHVLDYDIELNVMGVSMWLDRIRA